MSAPADASKIGAVDAIHYARAIAEALVVNEGTIQGFDVVIDPTTGKPAAAFAIHCAAGRFVVTVAERADH